MRYLAGSQLMRQPEWLRPPWLHMGAALFTTICMAGRERSSAVFASVRHAIQSAELVAVRVAQIGEIQAARLRAAHAGWVFDRCATLGDPGSMPEIDLVSRLADKTDCATIGVGSRLLVERLGNDEKTMIAVIEIPPARTVIAVNTFPVTDRAS